MSRRRNPGIQLTRARVETLYLRAQEVLNILALGETDDEELLSLAIDAQESAEDMLAAVKEMHDLVQREYTPLGGRRKR